MDTPIQAFLKKLGLSTKEIGTYLYCLDHGPQLISQLAKATGSTRTNTYDIIKKLEHKGLCHTIGSNYGKRVQAHDPEDIKELLVHKTKELTDLKNELDTLLPLFRNEHTPPPTSPFTHTSYFDGIDNLRKMIGASLQSKNKQIKIAGSELDLAHTLGTEYLIEYHIKRKEKNITLKALRPDSKRIALEVFKDDATYLREIRIRPEGTVRLKSNVILWDNYIALYSLKDKAIFGTLIENADMASMMNSWFDFIWEHSKKVK